ncbi:MAG: ABC transporter permease [Actinobacteria bacterium]|jgi:D-xylose transport system permease protein|nr:ABC transporter permease [Actinomycetota bacterium]NDA95198.1 ABC transporter permease [Actinomycetota bacterium]NDH80817.1 ABC transporter permease [Actinomycetota bacterium]NDH99176.1 ABC transporter permease [Actinomycetota bacterium]NDI08170.1 ABC transporter permease [Actinomycetota bacterium]
MSTEIIHESATLKGAASDYWSRVKAGDIGALPAILGLVALCAIFGAMSDVFLTAGNFANLLTQAAAVIVIAMGLVFVLLLGEIDLSAGYAAGVSGAVLVILITNHQVAWYIAFPISIMVGALLGFILGSLVARIGIPSFVVTLAAFLAFQGLLLLLAGEGGTIRIEDKTILAVENSNLSPLLSWVFFIVVGVAYVGTGLNRLNTRRRAGLKTELVKLWVIKTASLLLITGGAVFALTVERSNNPDLVSLKGIPYVVPLILFLLAVGTFVLGRTAFGRHIYAVGGNAEAARRAGINVKRVRISAFVICSSLAAVAGMIFASRQNSISPTTGGSSTLLYAVGAAVIGGTSLFGGKGKMRDAILGGLVVAVIDNGMGLLGYAAGIKFIVTGLVLLVSAGVDAVSRHGSSVS